MLTNTLGDAAKADADPRSAKQTPPIKIQRFMSCQFFA
jgi:hypothetical protein